MVPVGSTIVVAFSEPVMDVDTTTFTVAQGATGITGTVSANVDRTRTRSRRAPRYPPRR